MSENKPHVMKRRTFIVGGIFSLSALIGAIIAVPVISAMIAPLVRKKERLWRSVGKVDDFKIGETVLVQFGNADPLPWSGTTSETAAWLRRQSENEFIAFTVNCAHLGCPVRWIPDAEIFLCPCHGGVYNKVLSR
jgi:menaquinol-cytochrome c reductase iron-sulfur subunit